MTALQVTERLVKQTDPTVKKAVDAIHRPSLSLATDRHKRLMAQFRQQNPKANISEEALSVSMWADVRKEATAYAARLYADAQTELASWWHDVQVYRDERRGPKVKPFTRPADASSADTAILRELADLRADMHAARVRDDVKDLPVDELFDVLRDLEAADDAVGARVVERLIEKAIDTPAKPADKLTSDAIMQDKPKREAWQRELDAIRDTRMEPLDKSNLAEWEASRGTLDTSLRRAGMLLQTAQLSDLGGLRTFHDDRAA